MLRACYVGLMHRMRKELCEDHRRSSGRNRHSGSGLGGQALVVAQPSSSIAHIIFGLPQPQSHQLHRSSCPCKVIPCVPPRRHSGSAKRFPIEFGPLRNGRARAQIAVTGLKTATATARSRPGVYRRRMCRAFITQYCGIVRTMLRETRR